MVLIGRTVVILFASLFLISFRVQPAHTETPQAPHGKVLKIIQRQFSEQATLVPIDITAIPVAQHEMVHAGDGIYAIYLEEVVVGYLHTTKGRGRYDDFEYSLIYSSKPAIMEVAVTAYRSTHGAGVCQKRWLRQFQGYNGAELEVGRNIDAVSGGTLSAKAITEGVERSHQILNSLVTLSR